MPIIRIELFPGRSHQTKMDIARGITELLEEKAGISPSATTIMFTEIARSDWVVGGKPYAAPEAPGTAPSTPDQGN
jgi:4-oxalocrotonate tautomerase